MAIQVVRPKNRKEFMKKLIVPYVDTLGNPNPVFSDPPKLGQPEQNRAKEISVKNDKDKDFYIGIKDIDEAVSYYFNNVLKLSVVQNNTKTIVPIIYGNPENWKSVQADGYYRDSNGKLMAPLLMFKRTSITQNRNLGNKLDGNLAYNVQMFETNYTNRNFYSNFANLNSRSPEKKFIVSITPDYVTVEYECVIWTYFVEQMDKLVENLNFASRSYWGDPNRFQFYSSIESFQDAVTYDLGDDRAVRTNFTLQLNGYLISDSINKTAAAANRIFSASEIVFGLETSTGIEQFRAKTSKDRTPSKSILLSDSANIVNSIIGRPVINYLSANYSRIGTYVSPTTFNFTGTFMLAPFGFPDNNIDNFTFIINSTYIDKTGIVSFVDNGNNTCTVVFNSSVAGYTLSPDDTIIAIGKFI